uniref:CN hydrolase domain-containing protein n=1 Tax=Nelumbo nucifera TaxID=4432 RepID=A0A822YC40_NELNU|nr:TPA_asm: hypothetical protein HUJ06_030327 [Nelumbo nucifera]
MQKLAKELGVVIPVSFFEEANNAHYNSVAVIDADGTDLGLYRKSHIPDGPGYQEKFYFNPGDTGFKVFGTKFAKIGIGKQELYLRNNINRVQNLIWRKSKVLISRLQPIALRFKPQLCSLRPMLQGLKHSLLSLVLRLGHGHKPLVLEPVTKHHVLFLSLPLSFFFQFFKV